MRHVALRAADRSPVARERPGLGIPDVAWFGERDRRDPLSRREVGQPAALLRIASRELDRETRERVTEARARQGARTELLHHERELEQPETGAAERLGNGEARDAHLGEALPERRIVARARVEDLAQPRRGTFARDESAHGFLEQLLLLGETEVHAMDLSGAEGGAAASSKSS